MIVWSAIDPGCIHFSISILNNKINLDVNFKNFQNYFKFLEEFLNNLINYIVATFNIKEDKLILKIIIEKQIPQKFNKNLKLEYFLVKILKNISKTRNDLIIHYYLDRLPTRAKLARQPNCLFVVFDIKLESSLKKFKNKYNVK